MTLWFWAATFEQLRRCIVCCNGRLALDVCDVTDVVGDNENWDVDANDVCIWLVFELFLEVSKSVQFFSEGSVSVKLIFIESKLLNLELKNK